MIKSMTGYGQGEGKILETTYSVEIKTVNNRYFKSSIKLPDWLSFLEEDIEKLLRQSITRGTVNYILRVKEAPPQAELDIDERVLQMVLEKLDRLSGRSKIETSIDFSGLLNLPGVIVAPGPDKQTIGQIREGLLDITGLALEKVKAMRAAEGKALSDDLNKHCQQMQEVLQKVRGRSWVIPQEHKEKLRKRIDELLSDVAITIDEAALARESAVLADRSDISEEVARLDYHLEHFAASCQSNELAGRRLEFIGQEMFREANTIASKSSDSEIAQAVIDIKCLIDRIKEQVQNVE